MSTAIGDLIVRLNAQTQQFDKKMGLARRALQGLKGAAASTIGAFAPLAGGMLFAGMVRGAEQFNQKMNNSLAIMGNVSDEMKKKMEETAFDVARTTKFGAGEAAEAYFFLASAGLDAEQSLASMGRVAEFAQAGNFDLALATDLLTDAQSALGMTVKDTTQNMENMTRVSDVLIKANTLANATAQQFSESLTNKAGAALRIVGKDIEEGVAVLAAFADQGLKGAEAGTALNIVMRDLQTKAIDNKKAFKKVGVAVFDGAGEMRNMADIIADLENRLSGLSDEQIKSQLLMLGFTDKSIAFTQALIGTSEKIRGYETALRSAGGTTKEVADKQLTPLQKAWAKLSTAALEASKIFLEHVTPALVGLMKLITSLIDGIKNWIPWIIKLTLVVLAFRGGMLLAQAAIIGVNTVLRLYVLWQKRAAIATAIAQNLNNPAGWIKLAAGIAAAATAAAAVSGAFGKLELGEVGKMTDDMADKVKKLEDDLKELGKAPGAAGGPPGPNDQFDYWTYWKQKRQSYKDGDGEGTDMKFAEAFRRSSSEAWSRILANMRGGDGGPEKAAEKTAKSTEETAKHTARLVDLASERGKMTHDTFDLISIPAR